MERFQQCTGDFIVGQIASFDMVLNVDYYSYKIPHYRGVP